MVKDVIEGIKATEAKATAIIEEAKKTRGEAVAGAREEARKATEGAGVKGGDQVKQALEDARRDAEAKIESIAADEKEKCEKIRQAAAKNIARAVDAVIERMLK